VIAGAFFLGYHECVKRGIGTQLWYTLFNLEPKCNIESFFLQNQDTFKAIKEAIDNLDAKLLTDELREFARVIDQAIKDPLILREYKHGCKCLADAIIAVDSKGYGSFATQNYKESCVLTKVLGQRCYYLPNNPEHGIELIEHDRVDTTNAPGE